MQVPPWSTIVFGRRVVTSPPPYPVHFRETSLCPLWPCGWESVLLSFSCWVYEECVQLVTPWDWSPSLLSTALIGTCCVRGLRCSWWVVVGQYRVLMGLVLAEWRVGKMCWIDFMSFPYARWCVRASCAWEGRVCRWPRWGSINLLHLLGLVWTE